MEEKREGNKFCPFHILKASASPCMCQAGC